MMSIKRNLSLFATLVASIFVFSTAVAAQDAAKATTPTDPSVKTERGDRQFGRRAGKGEFGGRQGRHGQMGRKALMQGVDLTEAQKTQLRSLREANRPSPEAIDEIRSIAKAKHDGTITAEQQTRLDSFRTEMKAKRASLRQQIDTILTAEQKAQIETNKVQMKQRREEFRHNREQRRQQRDQQKPAADGTVDKKVG